MSAINQDDPLRPPGQRPESELLGRLYFDRDQHATEFGRMVTLCDGVFATALTVLVLSIEISERLPTGRLAEELMGLWPELSSHAISVAVIALFWFSHHGQINRLQAVDGDLMALNIVFLGLLVLIPFGQQVHSDYPSEPMAYAAFATILSVTAAVEVVTHLYANRAGLLRVRWSRRQFRLETLRGLLPLIVFLLSVPAAFVLVEWTPLFWILLLPIDRALVRIIANAAPA